MKNSSASAGNVRAARNAAKEILQKVDKAVRSPSGPKRWFWELLQNAIDSISSEPNRKVDIWVSLEKCELEQTARMHFSHNGGPFKETKDELLYADDFENLISPVSGKSVSDESTVGKFGTGFLSTHNLSLQIEVEGVLLTNEGERIQLKTTLDRTHYMSKSEDSAKQRITGIISSLEEYDKMKRDRTPPDSETDITKFTYFLNDPDSIFRVNTGFLEIEQSLPTVFALNDKVSSVTIEDKFNDKNFTYKKGEVSSYKRIVVNTTQKLNKGVLVEKYSVATLSNDKVTLSWPIENFKDDKLILKDAKSVYKDSLEDNMPILYCTFPLIGSDTIKLPITIHSNSFTPNETRDGISLTTEKITNKEKDKEEDLDKVNRALIESATELYAEFVQLVSIDGESIFNITSLNKIASESWIDKDWFKDHVIDNFRNTVLTAPIIDVSEDKAERKTIIGDDGKPQVFFPCIKNGETEKRSKLNSDFYKFCRKLYGTRIPLERNLSSWHNVLWKESEKIKILKIKDIVEEVSKSASISNLQIKLNFNSETETIDWINDLIIFIKDVNEFDLYKEFAILPNQEGNFMVRGDSTIGTLKTEKPKSKIENQFLEILLELDPKENWKSFLLHRGINLSGIDLHEISVIHISDKINEIIGDKKDNKYPFLSDSVKAKEILQTLLSFRDTNSEVIDKKVISIYSINEVIFQQEILAEEVFFSQDFSYATTVKLMTILVSKEIKSKGNLKSLIESLGYEKTEKDAFIWLNKFYEFCDTYEYSFIYNNNVFPDLNGTFRKGKDDTHKLYSEDPKSKIEPELLEILFKLDPEKDLRPHLVHREVKSNFSFEKRKLKDDVSTIINKLLLREKSKGDYILLHDRDNAVEILQTLLSYQKEGESLETNKGKVFAFIQDVFGPIEKKVIPFFQDFDLENVIKHAIRLINQEIQASVNVNGLALKLDKNYDASIIWLNSFFNLQAKTSEFDKLLHWANIIPNQCGEFCAHGKSEDQIKMYRSYEINEGKAVNFLEPQLIKNLSIFNPKENWKKILLHDGIELNSLPAKKWVDLGKEIDACVKVISESILNDTDTEKLVYKLDLLELLQWRDNNKNKAGEFFKTLDSIADKLYSQITFSKELVDIIKDEKTFNLAKKIHKSELSAQTIEQTIDKLEEMHEKLGQGSVDEFLNKVDKFIEKKELFEDRLKIGQNIEELLREALGSEDIDIIPDKSYAGAYDIELYKKNDPTKILKLEVKSYKHGSTFDFSFAPSQIVESRNDSSNYIVCTLEREKEGLTSIQYLKSNLAIQNNLSGIVKKDNFDKINMFNTIYKESKKGTIPLEIPCITDPRVKISSEELLKETGDYNQLIQLIKSKLL
ncbi:sacsin N-terminal ATP-binding-like domain-containing protein [Flavicella sediminum]|uniref:sacsin N-terminal ATP-binding-like domain-containing protein n=1 Tax=Flavicella sediminum TaxID=2585141 RepID=UPI001121EB35|nr:hypothetical protein [Flavicella sediminum]